MKNKKDNRLNTIITNKRNQTAKCIEYQDSQNISIQFLSSNNIIHTSWDHFTKGEFRDSNDINNRVGMEKYNNQGCLMKIIKYNNCEDVLVEFQDKYKHQKTSTWSSFNKGAIKNPYFPSLYGVGMIGSKYKCQENLKVYKEYTLWSDMLKRCFYEKEYEKHPTYKDVTCCEEWLLYENFYNWLHSQENFDKWLNGGYALDKDILVKGNKMYSPANCCLVPYYVNQLFINTQSKRGIYPRGVKFDNIMQKYQAVVSKTRNGKIYNFATGRYPTPEDAFYLGYKPTKEAYIKQIAQEEYKKGNITIQCYEAMMKYEVEITD